jgi:hypothetical protein
MQLELTVNIVKAILVDHATSQTTLVLDEHGAWHWWHDLKRDAFEISGYTFSFEKIVTSSTGDSSYNDDEEVVLVFKVEHEWKDARFFTVLGEQDSYDGLKWVNFKEAQAHTKTVIEYY